MGILDSLITFEGKYGQKLYHSPAVADFVDEIKHSFFRFMSIPDFVDDGARYFCVI